MKVSRVSSPKISLLAANLVPLVGVLLFGWDAVAIVLLYWAENVVLGFYNILKMAFLKLYAEVSGLELLFSIPFFCLHYVAFCAVHGWLLVVLFYSGDPVMHFAPAEKWTGPIAGLQMLVDVVTRLWQDHPPGLWLSIMCLFLSHGISFVKNYLGGGEYRYFNVPKLMIQPYKRILILHVSIVAAAAAVVKMGSPLFLLCVLVLLKTVMDMILHVRERAVANR